jgi:hypothetical protein
VRPPQGLAGARRHLDEQGLMTLNQQTAREVCHAGPTNVRVSRARQIDLGVAQLAFQHRDARGGVPGLALRDRDIAVDRARIP